MKIFGNILSVFVATSLLVISTNLKEEGLMASETPAVCTQTIALAAEPSAIGETQIPPNEIPPLVLGENGWHYFDWLSRVSMWGYMGGEVELYASGGIPPYTFYLEHRVLLWNDNNSICGEAWLYPMGPIGTVLVESDINNYHRVGNNYYGHQYSETFRGDCAMYVYDSVGNYASGRFTITITLR